MANKLAGNGIYGESFTYYVVSDLKIGLEAGTDRNLYATWKWTKGNTDHYGVVWRYYTGQGVWFVGSDEDLNLPSKDGFVRATYQAPANALRVSVRVQPHSGTYKRGETEIHYWQAHTATATFDFNQVINPAKPNTPTVTIDGSFDLVAEVTGITDTYTQQIEFEVVKDDVKVIKTGRTGIKLQRAVFQLKVASGGRYKVRCRAIRILKPSGGIYIPGVSLKSSRVLTSDWTDYTSNVGTVPNAPTRITSHKVVSATTVELYWSAVTGVTEYTVEYATSKRFFDASTLTKTQTVSINRAYIEGLDSGTTWYFRVKAKNAQGESGWSEIYSVLLGVVPIAPTTWSETSTAIVGETVRLYWVHNAEDGSIQSSAQVRVKINNEDWKTYNPTYRSENPGEASYLNYKTYITETENIVDASNNDVIDNDSNPIVGEAHIDYPEGMIIRWQVRTKGVMTTGGPNNDGYSPWSTERVVVLYAPPTIDLTVTDTKNSGAAVYSYESFPIYVYATAYPSTQSPVGWNISVVSNDSYETMNDIGQRVVVSAGDEIYSEYIPGKGASLSKAFNATDIDLENEQDYIIKITVSMNSGLIAEAQQTITMDWAAFNLWPNAEVAVDQDKLCAYIRPFCMNDEDKLAPDVTLTVCRREYDGRFVTIQEGIENNAQTVVTDPHPSLDFARYRIIAISSATGQIGFYDMPGEPVGEKGIIIQWDEEWSDFNVPSGDSDGLADPAWVGSMLRLPYNIKVSESTSIDKNLVEYIGRSSPVSYYGTQLGIAGSWSSEFPAADKDTVYALRRLQIYKGDCYVREPNGVGYWASINVSFNKDYNNLLIPVSIDVTRVEGGI